MTRSCTGVWLISSSKGQPNPDHSLGQEIITESMEGKIYKTDMKSAGSADILKYWTPGDDPGVFPPGTLILKASREEVYPQKDKQKP